MIYKGHHCTLRLADTMDADMILYWENDIQTMIEDGRTEKYSRQDIEDMLAAQESSPFDQLGQYRFIIETLSGLPVGMIDLFNRHDMVCEVGIFVCDGLRRRNYAKGALRNMESVARDLGLRALLSRVRIANTVSRHLFTRCGYMMVDIVGTEVAYLLTL